MLIRVETTFMGIEEALQRIQDVLHISRNDAIFLLRDKEWYEDSLFTEDEIQDLIHEFRLKLHLPLSR